MKNSNYSLSLFASNRRINTFFIDYNRCLTYQKLWFRTQNFKGILQILEELYNEHLIVGYKLDILDKKIYYKIYPKYSHINKKVIKHFKFVSRPGHKIFIRLRNLNKWSSWGSNYIGFLRTRYGFVSATNALKLKTGGELLIVLS